MYGEIKACFAHTASAVHDICFDHNVLANVNYEFRHT